MMNDIKLHRLDLNLLVTFEALMDTRSVSLAARKLGKTPSAVSHALARLRTQLGDPLMVKVGGKMRPSPFALTLIDDVRPILRTIQRVVQPPQPFDPATSRRVFRVAMMTIAGLMSRVFERVSAAAPNVTLEWSSPNQKTHAQIADGLMSIALQSSLVPMAEGVTRKVLPPVKTYTFARAGHPAIANWSRDEWLKWPHIMVDLGETAQNTVDKSLTGLGLERRIGARVPDFTAIAPLLARTNLLDNGLAIVLCDDMETYDLRILQPPADNMDGLLAFSWCTRLASDPGERWLRDIVLQSYDDLVAHATARVEASEVVQARPE